MFEKKKEKALAMAKKKSEEIETIKIIYEDGTEKEAKGSVWTVLTQDDENKKESTISKCIAVDDVGVGKAIRHPAKIKMVYEDLAQVIINETGMDLGGLEELVQFAETNYRMRAEENA